MPRRFARPADLAALAGHELAVGDAVLIDQDRIDGFAAHTEDRQRIHFEAAPEREGGDKPVPVVESVSRQST